jgi:hypothetical protein
MRSKWLRGRWYHNGRPLPPWPVCTWPGKSRNGRYWKRCLSKARRRAWRDERHPRGLAGWESTVNYKTW